MHPLYIPAPYQDSAQFGRLILKDGSTATIRVSTAGDAPAVAEFFHRLSPESRQNRFFSCAEPSVDLVRDLCDSLDPQIKLTLLVTRTALGHELIVGAGSYIARHDKSAEVAMAVDDSFQGKGIGAHLLERLALLAARAGFTRFWAVTHASNRRMVEVFRHSGFSLTEKLDSGYLELDFSVLPTQSSVELSEMRDRIVTAASLRWFFKPGSVAVIGASREPSSIGYRILEALVTNRFQGPVYPVNPRATVVLSMRAYRSVKQIPEPVDLAIIAVPRDAVLGVIDECAEQGVKGVIVISAGFAEVDQSGRELQKQLLDKVRGYGMRMVGPNCMGLLNTDHEVRLNASFSPVFPPEGRISMSSQSGALGIAILALATERRLGISTFISVGNKADVSGNDLLQYWEVDDTTSVILLYLESFGNPRRFARIARRVSRTKPIIAVKAGRTLAGRRAAGSHTAALAANDVAVDALFRQTGVIRAETLDEMFDIAATLDSQPLPCGRRIAIVTNAGGPGILCTDACEAGGLVIPELSEHVRAQLRAFLPAAASVSNPVDMIASARADSYRRTIETVLEAPEVDAMIVIYTPVDRSETESVAQAIKDGVTGARSRGAAAKPVLACIMSGAREAQGRQAAAVINASPAGRSREEITSDGSRLVSVQGENIPAYLFPESAAKVLAKAVNYAEWRSKPLALVPGFPDINKKEGKAIVTRAIQERSNHWLSANETRSLLATFGIPQASGGIARDASQAVEMANAIGFPVAMKLASEQVLHKSDIGAVRLNVPDEAAVRRVFDELQQEGMDGIIVQRMIRNGVELMIGVTQDPLFGPLIAFGLGGIHVEILADVRFRVTPLTDQDAEEMVREIRGYRLLQGYRGHPPADIAAIQEVLLRVSRMVEDIPEIRELDLNPIFGLPPGEGCSVVDARIRVGAAS